MTTSTLLPADGLAPPERPPWRTLAAVAAVVVAAHLALLGWVSGTMTRPAVPTMEKFVTRTIVIAPPAPPAVEPPKPEAAPIKPAAPPKPKPRPRPPPPVAAEPAPAPEAPPAAANDAPAMATAPDAGSGAAGATAGAVAPPVAAAPAEAAPAASGAAEGPVALKVPGSVRLKFAVTGQQGAAPLSGVFGELAWLQDGTSYDARLALSFWFKTLRSQHSQGTIGPAGIEPTRFSDTRKTEVASHFVRDKGEVVFSNNVPPVPLMPGAQDRLSVMLQLGALLAGDPARYPTDGAIAVQTVGPRDADIWLFKIGEEESLRLQAGDFVARKLTRTPRHPYDDTVELWLAPALGYLPVRIKLTQPNGDFADMRLREQLPGGGQN